MSHNSTVLSQLLRWVPRHEFEALAKQHHNGSRLRRMTRWGQFVALACGQLAGRHSLRDVVGTLECQQSRLYHAGIGTVTRSSLARVNEKQPAALYEALFARLASRCRPVAPGHGFKFKHPLLSLDASLIDLSLKVFPWAHYALGKAAMKLHMGLDHSGFMPAFATITDCHDSDLSVARTLKLPKSSMVVFDRGYFDYAWFKALTEAGVFFVTRPKKNAQATTVDHHDVVSESPVVSDQTIRLTGKKPKEIDMPELRRVRYQDPETGKPFEFYTNAFHLDAQTIADLYKARWQIELFFKTIKQNLKIKAFLGTSRNAVMTQIWVALCVYLLLAYLRFVSKTALTFQSLIRRLQVSLFMRRPLAGLLFPDPSSNQPITPQLALV
jgi:putative transposase